MCVLQGRSPFCIGRGLCPRTSAASCCADFVCLGTAGPARGFVSACGGGLQGAQRAGNPVGAVWWWAVSQSDWAPVSPGLCRTYASAAPGLV